MHTIHSSLGTAIKKIDRLDAELLLAFVLNKRREYILMHPEKSLSFWKRHSYFSLVKKRAAGVTFAYLIGEKEFYGRDFIVNKPTLVPRPDTEILIEQVLKQREPTTLIDVGTGSGCIPIAIKHTKPDWNVFAIDISKKALAIAEKNAVRHNTDITFLHGSLLQPFLDKKISGPIIITANLPYLIDAEMLEPSIQAEPRLALYGGKDGLDLYRELLDQINFSATIYFEINPAQVKQLKAEVQKRFGTVEIQVIKNFCGLDRIVRVIIDKRTKN